MHNLRLAPQFVTLFSSNRHDWMDFREPRAAEFAVPASVRVLHLLGRGPYGSDARHTPALAGAALVELHVDVDAWDARQVRATPPPRTCRFWLSRLTVWRRLLLSAAHMNIFAPRT